MRLQRARRGDRLVRRPAHVRVDHQREVGPEPRAHRGDALDVLRQPRTADLHLDRAEALREVALGLLEQRVEREHQVDAARIARHPRVEAAEVPPQRQAGALRGEVPQRDVDRGDREHRRAAATAVVRRPPHRLPGRGDVGRLAAGEQRREVALDGRVHRDAVDADGVGVADPLGALGVDDPHRDQLEVAHVAVRAVRQHDGQGDPVQVGADGCDRGHRGAPADGERRRVHSVTEGLAAGCPPAAQPVRCADSTPPRLADGPDTGE